MGKIVSYEEIEVLCKQPQHSNFKRLKQIQLQVMKKLFLKQSAFKLLTS
jgi:hypothetical protein